MARLPPGNPDWPLELNGRLWILVGKVKLTTAVAADRVAVGVAVTVGEAVGVEEGVAVGVALLAGVFVIVGGGEDVSVAIGKGVGEKLSINSFLGTVMATPSRSPAIGGGTEFVGEGDIVLVGGGLFNIPALPPTSSRRLPFSSGAFKAKSRPSPISIMSQAPIVDNTAINTKNRIITVSDGLSLLVIGTGSDWLYFGQLANCSVKQKLPW